MNIDEWFKQIRYRYASEMQCGKACTGCCYGLFDIPLADAVEVARGFRKLSPDVQQRIYETAKQLHDTIVDISGIQTEPVLFGANDSLIDEIVNVANSPRCPLLDDSGACLIYEHRPLACRLEGVPMVDAGPELFGDWCELNFKNGIPENALTDLQQDYAKIEADVEAGSAAVAASAGIEDPNATTFIPSIIVEYEKFWKRLLE